MGEDVGGVGCGDSVGSVYAGCVDYEVKRREVWEHRLGVGDVDCILLYMICFGDELGIGLDGLSWGIGCVGVLGRLGMLGECGAQA